MRFYSLDGPRARAITEFGSAGVTISPIARPGGFVQLARFELAAGGHIGAHPATVPQLFVVLAGEGWASGADGQRVPLRAGQAAFWEAGETHATGTEHGLTALVLEAETLDPSSLLAEVPPDTARGEGKQ